MKILLALLGATALAAPAVATVPIAGLINTGRNAGDSAVSTGAVVDAHWVLNSEVFAWNGGSNGSFPIGPWLAETAASRWLTPTPNAGDSLDPSSDGLYNFSLNFNLGPRLQPGTASFSGRFAADNLVSAATLNGNPINLGGPGGFGFWTAFTSGTAGFVRGTNTLTFTLRNLAQSSGNPAGLRVEFLSSAVTPVPEPATWAMLIAGFGLVGAVARRRKGVVAA